MGRALLARCSVDGLWWATIDRNDEGAFAHLGPDEGGAIWTEVSSDFHLPAGRGLTAHQHSALVARGWNLPLDEEGMENFHRSYPPDELSAACFEVVDTLTDVYGFREHGVLRVIVEPFGVPEASS